MQPPRIETERLLLREIRGADFEPYALLWADPEQTRYVGGPRDREAAWRELAIRAGSWMLRGFGHWALEERETGEFVGRAGIWQPEGWPGIEAGWFVARDRWGRGYATEAARAGVAWAFEVLGLDHVISLIHPENRASIRVAEKLGAAYERDVTIGEFSAGVWRTDRAAFTRRAR